FFFSSRRRHTRSKRDWSSDVCSSDLDATVKSCSVIACSISGRKGPEFPIHVVQPYPTRLKPSLSKYGINPASSRYRVKTLEPGANEVLTYAGSCKLFSTACFANNPDPNIACGVDVFVHDVIDAMAREPVFITDVVPSECSTVTSFSNSLSSSPKP